MAAKIKSASKGKKPETRVNELGKAFKIFTGKRNRSDRQPLADSYEQFVSSFSSNIIELRFSNLILETKNCSYPTLANDGTKELVVDLIIDIDTSSGRRIALLSLFQCKALILTCFEYNNVGLACCIFVPMCLLYPREGFRVLKSMRLTLDPDWNAELYIIDVEPDADKGKVKWGWRTEYLVLATIEENIHQPSTSEGITAEQWTSLALRVPAHERAYARKMALESGHTFLANQLA